MASILLRIVTRRAAPVGTLGMRIVSPTGTTARHRSLTLVPKVRNDGGHTDMTTIAALVFVLATAVAVLFQVALALGAPWGEYALGGRYPGSLPRSMRVAAVGQAALLAALAVFVLSEADIVLPNMADTLPWLIWLVVAFSALSLVLNTITRSSRERMIWAPVALVMLLSSLVVALGM
jgi:hypothetical protein